MKILIVGGDDALLSSLTEELDALLSSLTEELES